jgi:GDP-L-fucose synthase
MKEEYLLTGPLEPTNEAYAIAKIAGIKMCEAYRKQHGARFISVMPTNLYGPNDNFDLETSHVLPALIRRFHEAKLAGAPAVTLWGTGTPRREFLHVDDLADACVHLMLHYDDAGLVNIGWGRDIEIRELAGLVARVVGYEGRVEWDASRPDGTPRKLLDTSKLSALGWAPGIGLEDGVRGTYEWFVRYGIGNGNVNVNVNGSGGGWRRGRLDPHLRGDGDGGAGAGPGLFGVRAGGGAAAAAAGLRAGCGARHGAPRR